MDGLRVNVDSFNEHGVSGWAIATSSPDEPVILWVHINGIKVGETHAILSRSDLKEVGIGNGSGGFKLRFPIPLNKRNENRLMLTLPDGREFESHRAILAAEVTGGRPQPMAKSENSPEKLGCLDTISNIRFAGWVCDNDQSGTPAAFQIYVDDILTAEGIADNFRPDLAKAGIGDGYSGFDLFLPVALEPGRSHIVDLRRKSDGARLLGSPKFLKSFYDDISQILSNTIETASPRGRELELLSMIFANTDRMVDQWTKRTLDFSTTEMLAKDDQVSGDAAHESMAEYNSTYCILFITLTADFLRSGVAPHPVRSHATVFSKLGYKVVVLAADEMALDDREHQLLKELGFIWAGSPLHSSVEEALRRLGSMLDIVYLDGSEACARYVRLAQSFAQDARLIFNASELWHLTFPEKDGLAYNHQLSSRETFSHFEETFAVWNADSVYIQEPRYHDAFVALHIRQKINKVGFIAANMLEVASFKSRHGCCIVADFSYFPAHHGVLWFIEQVVPLLQNSVQRVELTLIGQDIPRLVHRLASHLFKVVEVGKYQNVRELVSQFKVAVVPLQFGNIFKTNMADILACGIPCVFSVGTAAALNLQRPLSDLICGDAAEMAKMIERLHNIRKQNEGLSQAGRAYTGTFFSFEQVEKEIRASLIGLGLDLPKALVSKRSEAPTAALL